MYPINENPSPMRKWIIALGIILILLVIGFFAMVFMKKQPGETVIQSAKTLFPFKNARPTNTTPNNQVTTPEIETPDTGEPVQPLPEIASTQKIRKITDFPVSGYRSTVNYLVEKENVYDEKLKKEVTKENKTPLDELYFARRDNGFLYHGDVTDSAIIQQQITQTRVPGVYESQILISPLRIIYRYATADDTIQSFFALVPGDKKPAPDAKNFTYCSSDFSRNLKKGNRGNDVLTVQILMNEKLGTTIKQDGIFGRETLATMNKFQEFLTVPVTGVYDQATRDALFKICTEYRDEQAATEKAAANIAKEPKEITGKLLDKNITHMVIDPSSSLYFSLIRDADYFVKGVITDMNGSSRSVFNSPLSEWRPQWVNSNFITFTTAASGFEDGYVYGLNPTSGGLRKLMGPYSGLVTNTSPDGRKILYSENTSNRTGISLWVKSIGRGIDQRMTQDTLAEKCTWSPDSVMVYCMIPDSIPSGNYPDDWYMGTEWFNDTLWQFNLTDGISTQIGIFPEEIDGYKLSVSPSGKYIYVVNRLNDNLWVVNLEK